VDGRHFYRIEGPDRFTEVQLVGSRALLHLVVARIYPEKVRIVEMVRDKERYPPITAEEWEEQHGKAPSP